MEIFSALLAICAGNSPVTGEFPTQRAVARSWDVCFYLRLNNGEAGDLRPHRAHYDVIVMTKANAQVNTTAGLSYVNRPWHTCVD